MSSLDEQMQNENIKHAKQELARREREQLGSDPLLRDLFQTEQLHSPSPKQLHLMLLKRMGETYVEPKSKRLRR